MKTQSAWVRIVSCFILIFCLVSAGCSSTQKAELRALQNRLAELDGDPVPVYTGTGPKIQKVKSGDIYVSLENRSCDLYASSPILCQEGFVILSERPLNTDSIRIEIPMETGYTVRIYETQGHMELASLAESGDPSSLDAYLCGERIDWKEFGQAAENTVEAQTRLALGISPETTEQDRAAVADYEKLRQGYVEEAARAAVDMDFLPEFYVYTVSLEFYNLKDETVEMLYLTVADEKRTVAFGQWRFHSKDPNEKGDIQANGVENRRTEAHSFLGSPYDGGLAVTVPTFELTTVKPVTLQRMWIDMKNVQLLGAEIDYIEAEDRWNSAPVHLRWDCVSDTEIPAGQLIQINAVLHDAGFEQFNTRRSGWVHLEYQCEGNRYVLSLPYDLQGSTNEPWMLALQVFQSYDLGPYFTSYYPVAYGGSARSYAGWLGSAS